MTPQDEMDMHERVKAHWANLGRDECRNRARLMKQAGQLLAHFIEGLIRVSKFDGDSLDRLQKLTAMAGKRYERRATAYYGE